MDAHHLLRHLPVVLAVPVIALAAMLAWPTQAPPPLTSLAEAGFDAHALDVRGHGASGTRGDIAHESQLDEDIADAVAELRRRHPGAALTMVGFSSGGGFTLRIAGAVNGELFDRYVMVAPLPCRPRPRRSAR